MNRRYGGMTVIPWGKAPFKKGEYTEGKSRWEEAKRSRKLVAPGWFVDYFLRRF
jgi:hypothetical protein